MTCKLSCEAYDIAFDQLEGDSPGVLFCPGFRSDMTGLKATALARICRQQGHGLTRFDYSGHGQSGGNFITGSIGRWLADTLAVLDRTTRERQILVGSSMGAWVAILAALQRPERIRAVITIAAAPDFTRELLPKRLSTEQLKQLADGATLYQPSEYDDQPYPISPALIRGSEAHLLLSPARPLILDVPVRLLHGDADNDVPWQLSLSLMQALTSADCQLTLVKDGDHRLSTDADIELLEATLTGLIAKT